VTSGTSVESNSNPTKERPAIRVMAADSTRMNSQMLADVLARDKRFHVSPTQISADTILVVAEDEKPDVVLLSPLLGDEAGRGFKIARELKAAHPALRVVMLLDRSERSAAVEAFRAGASGIFCRTESLKFLPRCISSVHAGQVWANSRELKFLLDALAETMPSRQPVGSESISILSKREQDVVRGVADGLSNREIASNLGLTEHTVKNYLFRIFDKLGVSSRVEVVLCAFGLADSSQKAAATMTAANRGQRSGKAGGSRKRPIASAEDGDAGQSEKDSRKALPL